MEAREKGVLAALLALTAAAALLLGASSASAATVFCEEDVKTCPKEDIYPIGTTYTATLPSGQYTVITAPSGGLQCTASTFEWTTTETTKEGVLVGSAKKVSISGCGSCSVEARNLPWRLEFNDEAAGSEMTISSSGAGSPALRETCGFLQCTYATASSSAWSLPSGRLLGAPLFGWLSGAGCEEAVRWDVEFQMSSPKSAYLTLG